MKKSSALRESLVVGAVLLAVCVPSTGQVPKDESLHNAAWLTVAAPAGPIQVEPTDEGRALVKLKTRDGNEVRLAAQSFTVTMTNGGFTLTGTGDPVLSGLLSLKAQSLTLTVAADGRSVLDVRQGIWQRR